MTMDKSIQWLKANTPFVIAAMLLLVSSVLVFHQAILSAVKIWAISEIFNHCFLVLPGAIYLIYRQRNKLAVSQRQTNYWLLLPIIPLLAVQVFGTVGGIQLFNHVALFSIIPLSILLIIGTQAGLKIPFPLVFILMAVPVGEQLIPHLQAITADMSVFLLQITGIPVFRNGLYIDIPEGSFLVAEACSGISFFISSIAFGGLYAHLSYQTNRAKILFFLFAASVPIFANALRVYGIIIIAHLTNMEHAVGADHLIYGWFFYALVLMIIFFVGERFRRPEQSDKHQTNLKSDTSWHSSTMVKPLTTLSCIFLVTAYWQVSVTQPQNEPVTGVKLISPVNTLDTNLNYWGIKFAKPSETSSYRIKQDNFALDIYTAAYYSTNTQGELVSSLNQLYSQDKWSLKKRRNFKLMQAPASDIKILELVSSRGDTRTIVQWYSIGQYKTGKDINAKLYGTYRKMFAYSDIELATACSFKTPKLKADYLAAIELCYTNAATINQR